jgi:L-2,4-diaminobutyrate transaminase
LTYPDCDIACARILERALTDEGPDTVAAFIAEPVLGLAGMIPPVSEFWRIVQEICRDHGILLIVDEVAMGFGRTGKLFASEHYGIEPDLLACAKGITGGYLPLGAVLATDRVYHAFDGPQGALSHGYTYGGHPAACAAALATLDIIERERLCERAARLGLELLARLEMRLAGCPVVGEVRGLGLALAIELVHPGDGKRPLEVAAETCNRLRARGVLTRPVGWDNVLPVVPPLTIPRREALELVDTYGEVVWELAEEVGA